MKFWKMNGAGNDFIVINNIEEKIPEEYRTLNKDEALDLAAARLQDLIRLLEDTEMPYDDDDVPFTE